MTAHLVPARVIPAADGLVEEVARLIEASGLPPHESLVVFPGRRPAHFLRRRLAQRAGRGFLPPAILSLDELVDAVFEERTARDGRVLPRMEPIDAAALLYEIQLGAERPIGGNAFMTLDRFFPIGLKIFADIEELLIEEVPERRVAEVQPLVEEEVPVRSRERLQTLARFSSLFYPAAAAQGLSTRSSRYRFVSETIEEADAPGTGPLILAGFFALSRAEVKLFKRISSWTRTQLIFQEGPGLEEKLRDMGMPARPSAAAPGPRPGSVAVGRGAAKPSFPRPAVHFYSSPDAHGQVFALGAVLGQPDEGSLVVLPDPGTLFPVLRHGLSRFDPDSYNVSLGYPLQRTPLYGFLDSLLELVSSMDGERVYVPAYVSFVLHPYVKNVRLGASAEATRVLCHALEERLAENRSQRFRLLGEIESDAGLFLDTERRLGGETGTAARLQAHLADIHARTIGRFRSFVSVRDFARRCTDLVSWVHQESTARDHPFFTPFSESFVQALETIERSLLAPKSFNDAGSYFLLLRRYLRTCYHPFQGTPLHGLQVLGALETRGLSFPRVFILDANEGSFPERGPDSTLLPLPVRKALGLPTRKDREDAAAYHFSLLTAGARELHLFSIAAGDKERSRFVERLLWDAQKEEEDLDEQRRVRSIQYRVSLSVAPPQPIDKTPEVAAWLSGTTFSATALDTYLRCPLQYYYGSVLHLTEREEASGEIEARDIGTFVHGVLAGYFAPRLGRALTPEDADADAMAALVEERFAQTFGPADAGATRLLHDQVVRHLRDFASHYLHTLFQGHSVSLRALEHPVAAHRGGFTLTGRLDAIQVRDGRSVLLDYKTSAKRAAYAAKLSKLVLEDRATWSTALGTLQLPFYVLLHCAESGERPEETRAMFLLLGRAVMDEKIEVPLFKDDAEARGSWPVLEAVIFGLLREMVSPEVPFLPAQDLRSACPRCPFTAICGTAWLKER